MIQETENGTKKKTGVSPARRLFSIVFFVLFLPIIAIAWVFVASYRFDKKRKFLQSDKKGKFLILDTDITKVDIMPGYEFEELLKAVYFYLGYKAETTKKSGDFGADLLLEDASGKKIVVQAKRYNKPVGARSVQEIAGAREHYSADDAWVVTNSSFTQAAELLARETDVRLVDRDEFVEHFAKAKAALQFSQDEKIGTNEGSTTFDGFGKSEFRI